MRPLPPTSIQLLSVVLVALLLSGCATPPVFRRYLARDHVEEAGFRLADGDRVRWRISGAGAKRDGVFELQPSSADCDHEQLLLDDSSGSPLPVGRGRWTRRRLLEQASETTAHAGPGSSCETLLVVAESGASVDPSFWVLRGQKNLGTLQTYPPRRPAWLPLLVPAVLADTVLVLTGVYLVIVLSTDSSYTWTPGDGLEENPEPGRDQKEYPEAPFPRGAVE